MKPEAVLRGVSTLAVRCLTAADCHRWDRFVAECPEATFFHQSGWAGVIEEMFGYRTYFLYAERSARIEGVLPLAFVDSWLTGRALVSLPFCIEAGVAAVSVEARAALEREALLIAAQLGVAHLEIRSRRVHQPDWPTQDLYVRFEKPILPEAADNLAAIPRKQRAVVRKGRPQGSRRAAMRCRGFMRCMPTTCTVMAHPHTGNGILKSCARCLVSSAGCSPWSTPEGWLYRA